MKDAEQIFSRMCLSVRQAGIVARMFQGKVQNDKKDVRERGADGAVRHLAAQEAKTVIDEVVQEILLLSLKDVIDPGGIILDAEEDTPLVKLFPATNAERSIIIDPIDGTLEYLEGKDKFTICAGLLERGRMTLALVFFPARDVAYAIAPDGKSYEYRHFTVHGTQNASLIALPENPKKIIYKMKRVPESIVKALERAGYEVIDDTVDELAASDAILKLLDGLSAAYVSGGDWMHDDLLGAILGNAKGAYTSDWKGGRLAWPQKGRVPEAIFGNSACKAEIEKAIL